MGDEVVNTDSSSEGTTTEEIKLKKEEYEKLIKEAEGFKERARLLDELLEDPAFQQALELAEQQLKGKEKDEGKEKKDEPKDEDLKDVPTPELIEKVIEKKLKPIEEALKKFEEKEQRELERQQEKKIADELKELEGNPEKYPYFSDVKEEMLTLLKEGRAVGLLDAYKLATYGKPPKEVSKKANKRVITLGRRKPDEKVVSTREALEMAADELGL